MLTYETVHTIRELVHDAALVYKDLDYLRFVKEDKIYSTSFAEFEKEAESIAAWTEEQTKKLGHPVRIAMVSANSVLYLKMLVGVICGGGVAVPMDAKMDVNTLCRCMNKAEVDILIYEPDLAFEEKYIYETCKGISAIWYMAEGEVPACGSILKDYAGKKANSQVTEKDCAVIIFTSGTTGEEKGVMLSNGNLVDNVFNTEVPKYSIKLNVLPFHHAFCLKGDILVNFAIGSAICLNGGMNKLGENLLLFEPTLLNMVPMVAQALYTKLVMLSREQGKSIAECKELVFGKNIEKIVAGGAHLPAELVEKYRDIGIFCCQGYGMTECSPSISAPDMSRPDKASSAGHIVLRCQSRVVDGELQVKSPSVMMGYVNAPELTAEIITEDGWLRTGDIGFEDEEGFIYITGRKKNLIILSNGENVSPEQIENLLLDYQLIEECLVYGEGNQIVAEIYPNAKYATINHIANIPNELQQIIQKVNAKLPSYKKIMKHLIRINPFQKTGSNKIVRNQRAAKEDILAVTADKEKRMPVNEFQKQVYTIVSNIIGHNDLGVDTDFFSVGLDSMGSIMFLTELHEQLKMEISLQDLFSHASVEKLEQFMSEKKVSGIDYSVREIYPLVSLQMYFAYLLKGNTTANLPFLFKLDESVDLERLKWAAEQVFEIHPEMKDTISMHINWKNLKQSGLVNHRNDARTIEIPIIKVSDTEWEEVKKTFAKPFTYKKGEDLFRSGIYITESANYFYFELAHVIGDGVSINVIFEDINALYEGKTVEKSSYTFYEYILDEVERDRRGMTKEAMQFFKQQTGDIKIRKSILNRKDSYDLKNGTNGNIRGNLDAFSKDEIQEFCRKKGISENIFFLTAFSHCVSVFANDDELLTTSVHSGRTDSRWQRIVGAVCITYCYRYHNKADQSVDELLKNSASQVQKIMSCGFTNMRADEILFQYQGNIIGINQMGAAPTQRQTIKLDSMPFHMQVYEGEEGYFYELRYWENRFNRKQLEVFLRCYQAVLKAMLTVDTVSGLENYISDSDKTTQFCVSKEKLNHEMGYEFVSDTSPEEICICVLDQHQKHKPYGAWGDLYIVNHQPTEYKEILNLGKEEVLYKTGYIARITPDGELELQENSGRTVMIESYFGRRYVDLKKMEELICQCKGVTSASAYTYFNDDLSIYIGIDAYGVTEKDAKRLKRYLFGKIPFNWLPNRIVCYSQNEETK